MGLDYIIPIGYEASRGMTTTLILKKYCSRKNYFSLDETLPNILNLTEAYISQCINRLHDSVFLIQFKVILLLYERKYFSFFKQ
ncbi:MAG: hypothetical protein WCB90_12290, partial [Methanosarcina sp.]